MPIFNYLKLNCTDVFDCTQAEDKKTTPRHILYVITAIIAAFGLIGNLTRYIQATNSVELVTYIAFLSLYIFSCLDGRLNTRFRLTIMIFTATSSLVCANNLILHIFWLVSTRVLYESEQFIFHLYPNYTFLFYFVFIRNNFGSVLYVFTTLMDIFLTWGRILAFKIEYQFLRDTSVAFEFVNLICYL